MTTLIIPCAGQSSRFPDMKPKWMLTHPDGELMIEKALKGFDLSVFERIIITIVQPHIEKYEAELILKQVFKNNPKIELCVLDDFTSCASETVILTLDKMNVKGFFVVKDSDNHVAFSMPEKPMNAIVGYNIGKHRNIPNIPGKSFLIVNEQKIISDIVEKKIVSEEICLGVYMFEDADDFRAAYKEIKEKLFAGEMYISHIISYILSKNVLFFLIEANDYEDWGTLAEWREVQRKHRTYFVDVDGILMKNCGRYGSLNWENNTQVLQENCAVIKGLQDEGGQIVITTSRTEEFKADLERMLLEQGICPYAILTGMNHAARVVINDFAPTNPYPSGLAISLPRNSNLKDYL